jgi:hypothetical protein
MKLGKRGYIAISALLVAALTVSASSHTSAAAPVVLPEGTAVHVRLDNALASNRAQSGEEFRATVSEPIVVDGKTVIPQGAPVKGLVVEARESGRLMGASRLRLELTQVELGNKSYDLRTASNYRVGRGHLKRNLAWIGGGGAGGALIGAIAGAGKGALIGGPVGAGVGTAVAYFTGKRDIRLPAESPLTFKLAHPVTLGVTS